MSLKKAGETLSLAALLALLANPIILLILIILVAVFLIAGIVILVVYKLVTALVFFIVGAIIVFFLSYTKAVDFHKHPYIALAPFVMGIIGYVCERFQIYSVPPAWIQSLSASPITTELSTPSVIFLLLVFIIIFATASSYKRE